ncbi:sulfite oxidase [Virgibacillus sp. C22-A2]|uniref:Sulfite oxidase n=1 Tax=Virgibacillus tibetensis TaxID=3042313 RepID=A0ABU6KFL0_9BACI|nr:sulfite oxidase [Virgibacillus sp. C22-A2]
MSKNYSDLNLIVRSLLPENQETPISFLPEDHLQTDLFFRRNHFTYPSLTNSSYWLPIVGAVHTPILFSFKDLVQMPSHTVKVVLECAGNKRNLFKPKVFGEQWEKGALSMGRWKGVSLKTLLNVTGLKHDATEVVAEGYDYGNRTDIDHTFSYMRSLPIEKALHPDTIIAYAYNDKPIPFKHGFPLRLIVPQWYAMASVKWIKQIRIINKKFHGPFQSIDYVYYPQKESDAGAYPVTYNRVNSIIQQPLNREVLDTGLHIIKGIAWTGKGTISKVELSVDHGETWIRAVIDRPYNANYEWINWSYEWEISKKGEYTLMAKATDSFNRTQPPEAMWNRKGYGYNAIDTVVIKIE